jgi:hypothetical protein
MVVDTCMMGANSYVHVPIVDNPRHNYNDRIIMKSCLYCSP